MVRRRFSIGNCELLIVDLAFTLIIVLCFCSSLSPAADDKPGVSPVGPLSARDEQTTFRTLKGFKVELVACEPDIVDPVAMAFDPDGRLYVVEMRGYPNEGVGTGNITTGRIKLLEDKDSDGFFEKSTIFADKLRLPTSVMPYKKGVLVCNAPEIIYLEDTDGDGKADKKEMLYRGFNLANIQQMVNSLQWGLDNWVHGCAGSDGGTVKSAQKPDAPEVNLRSRGLRFRPDIPGSLEPTSGGGQFGLAADDWGQWFTATNSQHLRHIVLPDHYLRRNPFLPVRAVTLEIPDHGAACKVHRISPFEAWRVERTTRRKGGPDAKRFPATELVPGGFITSACSPLIYRADLYPKKYYGNTLVCDPANNLIHRDILVENGATFIAKRADADCEFLASTDTWFRPVNLTLGPDGAVYVADFYREVIETPLSLPDDIKKKLNLESRGRGRIWRIVPDSGAPRARPSLTKTPSADLVPHLSKVNAWWRMTAQQLLVERQDKSVVPALQKLAREAKFPPGRGNALWTLQGLNALEGNDIVHALHDSEAGVREQAVRLAESRLGKSTALVKAVADLADDPSPRVRLQLAFSLGSGNSPKSAAALLRIAVKDAGDPWTQTAFLSSARDPLGLLEVLVAEKAWNQYARAQSNLVTKLASLAGAKANDDELERLIVLLGQDMGRWKFPFLTGLGQGLQNSQRSLEKLWSDPPRGLQKALSAAKADFREVARMISEVKGTDDRLSAIGVLGFGPFSIAADTLPPLLIPQEPQEVQLAAVRALSQHTNPKVADLLLKSWGGYSPGVRREVLESLLSRPERVQTLLDAMAKKKVLAGQLEPARLDQLRKHPNPKLRQQALKLLAGQVAPDRQKVVAAYQAALELKGDAIRGKMVFQKTCATCHRLENVGVEVGADLQSILRNKTPDALLVDILDPSREVDPRFIEYLVTTKSGKVMTGLIASESASSVTLRRAEKAEDTILRNQIERIQATGKSLMPEGLEIQLNQQMLADLLAYLQAAGRGN
jgi:putative membrane-bound dehydrogenase-like protein